MIAGVILAAVVLLLLLRFHVLFALATPPLLYFLIKGLSLAVFAQRTFAGVDEYTLVAIPLFILVGTSLQSSGVLEDLIAVLIRSLSRFRSGLALANVIDSAAFSGVSGSAAADVATLGPISIPLMKQAGYPASYAAAVTAATSIVGPIIPPSIVFIFYGAIANVSISDLLLAGVLPGFLLVASFAVLVLGQSRRFELTPPYPGRVTASNWTGAVIVIAIAGFIIISLASGVATATESAGIAALGAILFSAIRQKRVFPGAFARALFEAGRLSMDVLLLIAVSTLLAWVLTIEGASDDFANAIHMLAYNRYAFFVVVIVVLLFAGLFLDTFPAIILTVPVIAPVSSELGIDPLQTGVIVVLSLMVGAVHPPVGVCLYMSARIAAASIWETFLEVIPFIIAVVIVLILISVFPMFTTLLPSLAQ